MRAPLPPSSAGTSQPTTLPASRPSPSSPVSLTSRGMQTYPAPLAASPLYCAQRPLRTVAAAPDTTTPSSALLDRLADSNAEVTRLLRRQPDLLTTLTAAFQTALQQAFPAVMQPLDPDCIYITTYAENDHGEQNAISSQTMTQVFLTAIFNGTGPTYDQSRTGFFYLPDTVDRVNEVVPMRSSQALLAFERIVQDAVSASQLARPYQQALRHFWNTPDTTLASPQIPADWLASECRKQRQMEAQLRVNDGTLTETSRQWLLHAANGANVAELDTSASKPGVFELVLRDRSGPIPFSGIAALTQSPDQTPATTSGPVLLMIPGEGLMEFTSSAHYRQALQLCLETPALRSALFRHVALDQQERATATCNDPEQISRLQHQPIAGRLFGERLQSQLARQTRDVAHAIRFDRQQQYLPGTSSDQAANLETTFDITGILHARQQLLQQKQRQLTAAHDLEIERFAATLANAVPLSPAAFANNMIREKWGADVDPQNTRLVTLHYDYAGHEAQGNQPRRGQVARALSLTEAVLSNDQQVGDNRFGENLFGLYTPPRVGPDIVIDNTVQFPASLGHATWEGIYRQTHPARYDSGTQLAGMTAADFRKWIWELDFKEKYRACLQTIWPPDASLAATTSDSQRTLLKMAFVKTAFVQQAEHSLSAAGLQLALTAAGLDPEQRWEDVTPAALQSRSPPAGNVTLAPLAIYGYPAVDIWTCSDRDSGRILLYIPGNSSPLHEFTNTPALQTWVAMQARDEVKREALLTHFASQDLPDGGPFLWNKSGVRSALDGIAAYPEMRASDKRKYAGTIYPHHRPGTNEVWDPARYVQLPAWPAATDPFAHMARGLKQSMLAMVDEKIRNRADVRWDNLNWYIKSALELARNPLATPLLLEFPLTFAVVGLVDTGYAMQQAIEGKTSAERKTGAARAAFGLFNAVPLIATAGSALKSGLTAIGTASRAENMSAATIPQDLSFNGSADNLPSAASTAAWQPNRLRPALTGTIDAYAVNEEVLAGAHPDARGIYGTGNHWYIRYADDSGIPAIYEIRSDFKHSDGYVQIIAPETRQPLLTVATAEDGSWRRVSGTGGMPKSNRLNQLQQERETQDQQSWDRRQQRAQISIQVVDTLMQSGAPTKTIREAFTDVLLYGTDFPSPAIIKQNVRGELAAVMKTDAQIPGFDPHVLATNPRLLRERIEERIGSFDTTSRHYKSVVETYEAIKDGDVTRYRGMIEAMRQPGAAPGLQHRATALMQTIKVDTDVLKGVRDLQLLAESELEYLLSLLETVPKHAPETTRMATTLLKATAQAKAGSSRAASQLQPAKSLPAKNRTDILTVEGKILNGKPRSDNPNIVDILDPNGQRKATYLRSPNAEYWIAYAPIRTTAISDFPDSIDAAAWHEVNIKYNRIMEDAQSAENVAGFLRRKGDGLPSTPEGILEHGANRLKETASEIAQMEMQLATETARQRAKSMITTLNNRAGQLLETGREIRVELILKNPPTANGLEYLTRRGLVHIRQTRARVPVDSTIVKDAGKPQKVRDYLDEFEIKAGEKTWAYAHLHYPAATTDAEYFSAAHLKTPGQRYMGANAQAEAQTQGRRLEIHRGELYGPQVRKILQLKAA